MTSFIIRPNGDTNLSNAAIYAETGLPQTISGLAAGDYQVGRIDWSPSVVTVTAIPVPIATTSPTITGNGKIGSSQTGGDATWTVAPDGIERRWTRNGSPISGATGSSYTPASADDQTSLRYEQRARKTGGAWSSWSQSSAVGVTYVAPTAAGALSGRTFTENTGVQAIATAGGFTGQALVFSLAAPPSGVTIDSSTGVISVDTGVSGTLSATSIAVQAMNSGGSITSAFSLTVSAAASSSGLQITSVSLVLGNLDVYVSRSCDLSYYLSQKTTETASTIRASGATVSVTGTEALLSIDTSSLAAGTWHIHLVAHDAGSNVSAVDSSASFAALGALAPVNTTAPAMTGTKVVGQTLSVSTGTWNGNPTSYTYRWMRDGAAITGASASSYTTVATDGGKLVGATVAATNATGTSAPVAATGLGTINAPSGSLTVAAGTELTAWGGSHNIALPASTTGDLLVVAASVNNGAANGIAGWTEAARNGNFVVYTRTSPGVLTTAQLTNSSGQNTSAQAFVVRGVPSSFAVGTLQTQTFITTGNLQPARPPVTAGGISLSLAWSASVWNPTSSTPSPLTFSGTRFKGIVVGGEAGPQATQVSYTVPPSGSTVFAAVQITASL